jgi:hypothetical protein
MHQAGKIQAIAIPCNTLTPHRKQEIMISNFYLSKNLRKKPKIPPTRLKLISNFSSTKTENSKTSLLMINDAIR